MTISDIRVGTNANVSRICMKALQAGLPVSVIVALMSSFHFPTVGRKVESQSPPYSDGPAVIIMCHTLRFPAISSIILYSLMFCL